MKINIKTYLWLLFLSLLTIPLFAQTSINAAAINSPPQNDILQTASIGQVFYLENASANTQEVQGVQQPLFIEVLSTEENNPLALETSIYPNPTNNSVHFEIKQWDSNLSYKLYDTLGKQISANTITAERTTLQMDYLSSGIYILQLLENNSPIKITRIVKR